MLSLSIVCSAFDKVSRRLTRPSTTGPMAQRCRITRHLSWPSMRATKAYQLCKLTGTRRLYDYEIVDCVGVALAFGYIAAHWRL